MLNKSTGNMYEWVTHTWNTVKGRCPHNCSYCYVKRWGKQSEMHFDEKELRTELGSGNFIFVGSGCDMFAEGIPEDWIKKTLKHCDKYPENRYLFQSKNPAGLRRVLPSNSVVCVTLETNRYYPSVMNESPMPYDRVAEMQLIRHPLYLTIEPIMMFDLDEFINMIHNVQPMQVNIGADSGRNGLPEPDGMAIRELIGELSRFTVVKEKSNLKRLLR